MPTYLYKCRECDSEFEEVHRVAEREIPLDKVCGSCGKGKIRIVPQLPSMISMRDTFHRHTSDGWKDRLKEIKRANPGSTLEV